MLVYCTKCGHEISTSALRCPGCGASPYRGGVGNPSNQVTQIVRSAPPPVVTVLRQPSRPQVVIVASQKSAGLAAVLSAFWPGFGQIYNGQILKGVALSTVSATCAWFGLPFMFFGGLAAAGKPDDPTAEVMFLIGLAALIATPTIWLYSIVNAHRTAERINRRQLATY